MTIDGSLSGVTYVGDWQPGEQQEVTFDLVFARDVTPRPFGLLVDVRYDGLSGERIRSDQLTANVTPAAEQSFAFTDIESSLRVDDTTGRVRGTIENTGDLPVRDLTLSLPQAPASITGVSGSVYVDTLVTGETARFSLRGNVSPHLDPGVHQIELSARYRTVSDSFQHSTHIIAARVAERQDALSLRTPISSFESGYSGILRINVTNQVSEELRDIQLRLGVEEPIESDFRTTMISELAPGEMAQVTFDIDIDSDAPQSQFPIAVDVVYTTPKVIGSQCDNRGSRFASKILNPICSRLNSLFFLSYR